MYAQQQIQQPFQGNLKLHQQHSYNTIAGNASTAFPASLLSASAKLSNHFFKTTSSFDGEPPVPPPSPKPPVMASKIVEIVIKRTDSIENIVMPFP